MHSATSQCFWRGVGQGGQVHAGGHSSVSCLLWALLGSLTAGAAFARSYIWGLKICICWHCDFLLGKWNPQQNSLMLLPGYLKADPLRVCLWASMLLWSANVQAPWRGFRVKHTFFSTAQGAYRQLVLPPGLHFPPLCCGLQPTIRSLPESLLLRTATWPALTIRRTESGSKERSNEWEEGELQ